MAVGDKARCAWSGRGFIGLFRYQLIREAADAAHSTMKDGASWPREHTDPFGRGKVRPPGILIDR